MTQAVQADRDELDAFHELLPTLAQGLDVRDIFRQLSAVAARIVPHDEATLLLLDPEAGKLRLYATTNAGHDVSCCEEAAATITEPIEPRVFEAPFFGSHRGLQSGLTVPVRNNGEFVGLFGVTSYRPHAYGDRDVAHAERLAGYLAVAISHQRLAEQARDAAIERERAANVETSVELLRTISDVLDIRSVIPQISEIANKVLPHDALTVAFFDPSGRVVVQAATSGFPDVKPHVTDGSKRDHMIIGDLSNEPLPLVNGADDVRETLTAAGLRAVLAVNARARDQLVGVGFWSRTPGTLSERDLPIARRILDHIVLAVSHEQLAEAARDMAEAKARAERLEARVQMLSDELDSKSHNPIVGDSKEWRDVLKKATQVAATDTTVLLTGQSGTGKEVVARFIHRASGRKNGPFVALNCAALPEQLLESELFGYERGAFTSAQQSKPGQIELAAGGVLFLDEVSEMSPSSQAKFLRVLQEREFQRLGGTKVLKANIRVVAATNRDLRKAVERGDFREDLFYRLQVFDINIAPLRERTSDILPLSDAFLREIGKSFGRPPAGLTKDAREALMAHTWPGNVRELRNALERAAILAEGGLIHADHLALSAAGRFSTPVAQAAATDLSVVERETIARVLQEMRWNKSRAAKRLGLSRTQLYGRMRKYGLDEPPPVLS
jgi:transcriptional regulator with GAF, ATPase, and Fis domain